LVDTAVPAVAPVRARRLRAPLLLALWMLLGFEAVGGIVIFVARLVAGSTPGEALHVAAGVILTAVYAVYQWRHWLRVRPFQPRLHYGLGVIAAVFMGFTNLTGLALGVFWWRDRFAAPTLAAVDYPVFLSAVHNVASMVVLTFVAAHVGAVLFRTRNGRP